MTIGSDGGGQGTASRETRGRVKQALIDAQLACAEALLAENKTSRGAGLFTSHWPATSKPRLVRLAATRGMLACASDKPQ